MLVSVDAGDAVAGHAIRTAKRNGVERVHRCRRSVVQLRAIVEAVTLHPIRISTSISISKSNLII